MRAITVIAAMGLRFGGASVQFVLTFVVAAVLSQSAAGEFFLGYAVAIVLGSVGALGLHNLLLRDLSRCLSVAVSGYKITARSLQAAGLAAGCASMLLAVVWWGANAAGVDYVRAHPVVMYVAPAGLFVALNTVAGHGLQALQKDVGAVTALSLGVPLTTLLFIFAGTPGTATGAALMFVASTAISAGITVAAVLALSRRGDRSRADPSWQSIGQLYWKARNFAAISVMQCLIQWGAPIIASSVGSSAEVAELAVASRVSQVVSLVLLSVNMIAAPRVAQLYAQGRMQDLRKLFRRTVFVCLVVGGASAGGVLMWSEDILSIFGAEYQAAAAMLLVLMLGQVINVVTGPVGYVLSMSGNERDMRLAVLAACATLVVGGLILGSVWGVEGVAVAVAASIATQNILATFFVRRRLGFVVWEGWVEPFFRSRVRSA